MSKQQDIRNQKHKQMRHVSYDAIFGVVFILFVIVLIWGIVSPVPTYQGMH